MIERAQAGGKFPEPAQLLFGVLGETNGLGEPIKAGLGANRANPCKSYSSSVYIDIGTVRIAFLWRKTVQKSYYSRVYIDIRPGVIAFCSAKRCKTSYSSRPYMNIHPVRIAYRTNVPGFGSTLPQLHAICAICAIRTPTR